MRSHERLTDHQQPTALAGRSAFEAQATRGFGVFPPGYTGVDGLVAGRAVYDYQTQVPRPYAHTRPEVWSEKTILAPEVSGLLDSLDLTPAGRNWFLAARPRVVEIARVGNQLVLPDDCRTRRYDSWRAWWRGERTKLPAQLDQSLRSHFVGGLVGSHWPKNGRIEVYDTPIYPAADLGQATFHELLHALHAVMTPYQQRRLYNDLIQLLQLPAEVLDRDYGLSRDDLTQRLVGAGQRWQAICPIGSEPAPVDQFLDDIHCDRLGQFWLPSGRLHERAVVAILDEAYAHIGSSASADLGPALEAHYQPYCRHRAQMVGRLGVDYDWPARSDRVVQYLDELQQLAEIEALWQAPSGWTRRLASIDHCPDSLRPQHLADCLAIIDRVEADLASPKSLTGKLERCQLEYCLAKAKVLFHERLGCELQLHW